MTMPLDPGSVPTPCFVCDLSLLECNLRLLADVQARAGCRILLALKGFAMWSTFPLLRRYLHGVAASGLHEALLGHEHFGREVHVYSPAFAEYDFARTLEIADHVVFNSLSQWERLRPLVKACGREVRCGIRINPEHSEVQMPLYDPC